MNSMPLMSRSNALSVVGAVCLAVVVLSTLPMTGVETSPQASLLRETIEQPSSPPSLFVHGGGEDWYQPLAVYPSRFLLAAAVPRALALPLPSMLAGIICVVLVYLLAVGLTKDDSVAAVATLVLIVMPGFRNASRTPGAELWTAVFVLMWLLSILRFLERPRTWVPFAGGIALGACIYSEPSGVLSVPVYLLLGAWLLIGRRRAHVALASAVAGVALAALPGVVWVVLHRDAYPDTFGRWAIHAAHLRSPNDGIVAFTRWPVMARRVEEYWHYLSPTFVFGRELLGLLPLLFIAVSVWTFARQTVTVATIVIACGLLLAPVPAVLLDIPRRAELVPLLLPLGAVCAAMAVPVVFAWLGSRSGRVPRPANGTVSV